MNALPEGWTVEPFSQVASYTTGRTPARANPAYWAKGERQVPWVAISDMDPYGIITETAESVSALAFENVFRKRILPAGTLIMSFKLTIGRVATLGIPACHNEAIISIFPREGVDQRYLGYFLSQVDYTDHQDRQIKGNTLNQSKIDQIQIVLPPSNEQSLIADVLDKCRLGINTERIAEKTAEELKRAAMRELFTRGLRGEPQKETEIGLVPESWEVVSLESVAQVRGGTSFPPAFQGMDHGDLPFYKVSDMNLPGNEIKMCSAANWINRSDRDQLRARPFPCETIIFPKVGGALHTNKKRLLTGDSLVDNNIMGMTVRDEVNCLPKYLFGWFQTINLSSIANAGPLPSINASQLYELKLPLPSLDEQRDIVAILDAIDRKLDLHRKKRAVLEELFKALLHKLMTGEIRVADLDLSALEPQRMAPAAP